MDEVFKFIHTFKLLTMPLTPEQRQIMLDEMAAKRMQDFIDWQDQQGDEYHNRVKIFRTHYKGNIIIPAGSGFHPMFFKGTEKEYDFVIDGTDNFPSKFLINDACYFEKVAYSHAGILRFDGQLITVIPDKSACYRCIFDAPPPVGAVPSCSQAGVFGVLAGVIGSLQATEAIKYLLGLDDLLTNSLLTYDAMKMTFRKLNLSRNPDCPLCGENPKITELFDEKQVVCDLKEGCCGN